MGGVVCSLCGVRVGVPIKVGGWDIGVFNLVVKIEKSWV